MHKNKYVKHITNRVVALNFTTPEFNKLNTIRKALGFTWVNFFKYLVSNRQSVKLPLPLFNKLHFLLMFDTTYLHDMAMTLMTDYYNHSNDKKMDKHIVETNQTLKQINNKLDYILDTYSHDRGKD